MRLLGLILLIAVLVVGYPLLTSRPNTFRIPVVVEEPQAADAEPIRRIVELAPREDRTLCDE